MMILNNDNCDAIIRSELQQADIRVVVVGRMDRPVSASVKGILGRYEFIRSTDHFVVKGFVPIRVARKLYKNILGKRDIRIGGFDTCPPPEGPWVDWVDRSGRVLVKVKRQPGKNMKWQDVDIDEFTVRMVKNPRYSGMPGVMKYSIHSIDALKLFVKILRDEGMIEN